MTRKTGEWLFNAALSLGLMTVIALTMAALSGMLR